MSVTMSDFVAFIEEITLNIGEHNPQDLEAIKIIGTEDIKICFKDGDSSALVRVPQESFPTNGMVDVNLVYDNGDDAYAMSYILSRDGILSEVPFSVLEQQAQR